MNTVVSQALATGLPVVVTRHSGLPEQVVDGRNGAIAEEGDPCALAEMILLLLEHPERWPEFGRFGRNHVSAHYDAQQLIDRQIADYRALSAHH